MHELYPYDDVLTTDGYLWFLDTQSYPYQAVVVFENVSPRFMERMNTGEIVFNMRSRLCQLGLDCVPSLIEKSKKANRIECTVAIYHAKECAIAAKVLEYIVNSHERMLMGKLFLKLEHRVLEFDDVLKNIYTNNGALIDLEKESFKQGKDNTIIIPLDKLVYVYDNDLLPNTEQLRYLLYQGMRKDLNFFRKQFTTNLPHTIKPEGWFLGQLTHFRVKEHFALIEALSYKEKRLEKIYHSNANLFDPLSYKSVISPQMIEIFSRSDVEEKFDGVAIKIYRPSKRFCSIQVPADIRLNEIVSKSKQLQEKMDESLAGTTLVNGKRIKHAAFIVDASEMNKLETYKNTEIVDAEKMDIHECPELDIIEEMEDGYIKSKGFLLSYYFPRWDVVSKIEMEKDKIHSLIFRQSSQMNPPFFSEYDVQRLKFLKKLGIDIIWVQDDGVKHYYERNECGFFLDKDLFKSFSEATFFACYGSSVKVTPELTSQLSGFFRQLVELFGKIGVVTGGGPGLMEAVNKIATQENILSAVCCLSTEMSESPQYLNTYANVAMFFDEHCRHIRQNNFSIARFPIFFPGGLGTFEEVGIEVCNLKLGLKLNTPYLFIGKEHYANIHTFFKQVAEKGMVNEKIIKNLFLVDTLDEAIEIYREFMIKPMSMLS